MMGRSARVYLVVGHRVRCRARCPNAVPDAPAPAPLSARDLAIRRPQETNRTFTVPLMFFTVRRGAVRCRRPGR
jgi:hypothetical protein